MGDRLGLLVDSPNGRIERRSTAAVRLSSEGQHFLLFGKDMQTCLSSTTLEALCHEKTRKRLCGTKYLCGHPQHVSECVTFLLFKRMSSLSSFNLSQKLAVCHDVLGSNTLHLGDPPPPSGHRWDMSDRQMRDVCPSEGPGSTCARMKVSATVPTLWT